MTETDEVTVYWAPAFCSNDEEWIYGGGEFLYPNPLILQSDLMKEKNPHRGPKTHLSCPAATSTFTRTAVFYNSRGCSYDYDLTNESKFTIIPKESRYLNCTVRRPPALNKKPTIEFQLRWVFFSEESLEMSITPPMFHQPKHTKYVSVVPGQYDIGRWFRPVIFEVQAWEPKGVIKFEENEPLLYATFHTNKKVNLKRFVYTNTLLEYAHHCINFYENEPSLEKRYELFDAASTGEIILQEIKKNLIG
jgi:hypothetical protein